MGKFIKGISRQILSVMVGMVYFVSHSNVHAQLPPSIEADRLFVQAERQISEADYDAALATLDRILALQEEYEIAIPAEFWYRHAEVAFSAGSVQAAKDSAEKYLVSVGNEGEFYRESLRLLDTIEQIESRFSQTPKCEGQLSWTTCWMAVGNQPECYVWNSSYAPDRESVTWTGKCTGALAQGKGTLTWSREGETIESTGTYRDGKRQGNWVEQRPDGILAEGAYLEDEEHGDWRIINPTDGGENSGRVQEIAFVEGSRHGLTRISWPSGQTVKLPYERGVLSGRSERRFGNGSKTVGSFVDFEKSGEWEYFDSSGSIWKKETYSLGKLNGPWVEYGEDCTSRGNYVENEKNGEWVDCSYQKRGTGSYVNGQKEGRWVVEYMESPDGYGGERPFRQVSIGTQWYEAGKGTGVWTSEETYLMPGMRDLYRCFRKSKVTMVDGEMHGEAIALDNYCQCWRIRWEEGKQLARKKVSRRTCNKELNW